MAPGAVLAAYPGANFVARARLTDAADEVWGILVRVQVATAAADGPACAVETDDGRRFAALAPGDGRPAGDPAAVLAEARYWELPPSYVAGLVPTGHAIEINSVH